MFNGILNNNGFEQNIKIRLSSIDCFPYDTDVYINNAKYQCKIDYDVITFLSSPYEYKIKKTDNDEILIVGKEQKNIFHRILCCMYEPKFFVLTNKEDI